jgi:hypothetical protein
VGYKSALDSNALVGVNQRIIDGELARKKEEYLNHEELAKIAKLYDSNEVISISSIACWKLIILSDGS